jgi:hypothetical protein
MRLLVLSAVLCGSGLLMSACESSDGNGTASGTATSRADRNRAVLDELPLCPEATAVREFSLTDYDGPDVLGRDYALGAAPDDCLRALSEDLTAAGWQDDLVTFRKDGDQVRVQAPSSELVQLDLAFDVSHLADPPDDTVVYLTVAVTADLKAPSPTARSSQ